MSEPTAATTRPLGFDERLHSLAMSLLIVAVLVFLLREFAAVLQPLLIAVFLGYLTAPVRRWLTGRGVPRLVAQGLIALAVLAGLALLTYLVYASLRDFRTRLPEYEANFEREALRVAARIPIVEPGQAQAVVSAFFADPERVNRALSSLFGSTLDSLASTLGLLGAVVVFLLFLIAEQATWPARVSRALSDERAGQVLRVAHAINRSISEYVAVKTLASLLTAALTLVALWAFDVDFSLLWGLLTFLANFVPYVGSFFAVLLPVLLDLVQSGSYAHAAALLIILIGVQQFIGIVVEPRLIGERLDLSPLMVILSLAFWGTLWGVPGMILAVPLVVVVRTTLAHIPQTTYLAALVAHPVPRPGAKP